MESVLILADRDATSEGASITLTVFAVWDCSGSAGVELEFTTVPEELLIQQLCPLVLDLLESY